MFIKNKMRKVYLAVAIAVAFVSFAYCKGYFCKGSVVNKNNLTEQDLWDENYLDVNPAVANRLMVFQEGMVCRNLTSFIVAEGLNYEQIVENLLKHNYQCSIRNLTVSPDLNIKIYLKKNGSTTSNPSDPYIAKQTVCVQKPYGCVVRLKPDGLPGSKRTQPHFTKGMLIDPKDDPASYANEAFKVSKNGHALPKGPGQGVGLIKCPHGNNLAKCEKWVDRVMDLTHIDLAPSNKQR